MAEIATYNCSNTKCLLSVRLSYRFPIWHPNMPKELRTLSVTPALSPYVVDYHSDAYCHHCRKVVVHMSDNACPRCKNEVRLEQSGHPCPQCLEGRFLMTALSVY